MKHYYNVMKRYNIKQWNNKFIKHHNNKFNKRQCYNNINNNFRFNQFYIMNRKSMKFSFKHSNVVVVMIILLITSNFIIIFEIVMQKSFSSSFHMFETSYSHRRNFRQFLHFLLRRLSRFFVWKNLQMFENFSQTTYQIFYQIFHFRQNFHIRDFT